MLHVPFLRLVKFHVTTALLFTWTDFKTIFFPITVFACATAPLNSPVRLFQGCCWIWLHLLLCNVSNQVQGHAEDAINHPWRPLPSGRLTKNECFALRWVIVGICLMLSVLFGNDMVYVTLALSVTTILYDECGLSGHPIGKNLCAVGGYISFEVGATKIIGPSRELDIISLSAISLSGIIILTTIHSQDFSDVEGDKALGRMTLPIYAPELSRLFTLFIIPFWSSVLCCICRTGMVPSFLLLTLGSFSGFRYFQWRTSEADKLSYLIYNIWLTTIHLLTFHVRRNTY
ncbi:hypothetical protein K435DRAFT_654504 [Dendrothele bispora CBS 962.96]|uniref:UbiA prenyltransferase n=1 Tax=Dendrothele bispora (strain CBS 962.96) TaxID=1314807 RepID=A0A4S8MHB2_DENBC|nr:hypothetical protein K435DRAFT_654504 [Dendrothele bispora CBS 962.96]